MLSLTARHPRVEPLTPSPFSDSARLRGAFPAGAFLADGSRVLPMAGLTGTLTVEQADALAARLRDG
jgi:hypothetical protein